ncbi:hemin receptor [Corynebacterium sp. ES2794-CONJ1]|uniref:hemin receptor n=1 Tax=unclassified Corynebacterium TaxID=2624378 RepID=UPI002167CFAB|nr:MULTISPECIES: hemin receptor [unclassified Corynebacterium]MCS4489538.1 hemin receptor [Corynebacterium sp. ES2775-CONJ]MCS4531448.1 hemin receptor [Corynebacterium sp. ES2730-CONJ]MCU9518836.1 hemin receptor [Corynebacterium sp. ES2794-CONJ1]
MTNRLPSTSDSFQFLYPDVDPQQPLPLSLFERFACAGALALFSFGFIVGDAIVLGVAFLATLFATIAPAQRTSRRIRKEARDRFPQLDWAEKNSFIPRRLGFVLGIFWVVIAGLNAAIYFLIGDDHRLVGAGLGAGLTFLLIWVLPGFSPRWTQSKDKPEQHPTTDASQSVASDDTITMPQVGSKKISASD